MKKTVVKSPDLPSNPGGPGGKKSQGIPFQDSSIITQENLSDNLIQTKTIAQSAISNPKTSDIREVQGQLDEAVLQTSYNVTKLSKEADDISQFSPKDIEVIQENVKKWREAASKAKTAPEENITQQELKESAQEILDTTTSTQEVLAEVQQKQKNRNPYPALNRHGGAGPAVDNAKSAKDLEEIQKEVTQYYMRAQEKMDEDSLNFGKLTSKIEHYETKVSKPNILGHIREQYLNKNYPEGIPSDITSKELKDIEKEIQKQTNSEHQKMQNTLKDAKGEKLFSGFRNLNDSFKNLEHSYKKMNELHNKLGELDQEQTTYSQINIGAKQEIDNIKHDLGYEGIKGWFRKKHDQLLGDEKKKKELKNLQEAYKIEKDTRGLLSDTAKKLDKAKTKFQNASREYDKSYAASKSRIEAKSEILSKYTSSIEKTDLTTQLGQRKSEKAAERQRSQENIEKLATMLSEKRGKPGVSAPTSSKGQKELRGHHKEGRTN